MKFIPPKLKAGEFALCDIEVNGKIHFRMVTDGDREKVMRRVEKKKIKNVSSVKLEALIVYKKANR